MTMPFKIVNALTLVLAGLAPAQGQDAVDQAAAAYIGVTGFQAQALENLEGALGDLIGADPAAMIPKDADVSPIEKALLLLDTQETPVSRARYVLRYNQESIANVELSFIDVQRYNLGPTIHEQTVADYGADNTAPLEVFGVGPHVEWRFVTQPTAKQAALLLAASRREISDAEAAAADCLPRLCLSLEPLDGLAHWSDSADSEQPPLPVAYPPIGPADEGSSEVAPAYQALELAIAAGLASASAEDVVWTLPERQGADTDSPFLVVLIDRNLGQETMSDAALGVAKLGLDSDERWTRVSSYTDGTGIVEGVTTAPGPLLPPTDEDQPE